MTNDGERRGRKEDVPPSAISAVPVVLALVFLALHLPYLTSSLEDVDSINFALGMRRFDVAHHQPHPPGYPIFILAANAAHAVIRSQAKALAAVSVAAGTLGVIALFVLFRRLDGNEASRGWWAVAATAVAMTAPLYWFTSARPLSDGMGLIAAVGIQAAILASGTARALTLAAFFAGLAVGIRSQVLWLTLPLLVYRCVVAELFRATNAGLKPCATGLRPSATEPGLSAPELRPSAAEPRPSATKPRPWATGLKPCAAAAGAFAAGALVWFLPLVMLTGGPAAYWRALSDQGVEDLSGIRMLWTTPTPRAFVDALYYAFVAPWAVWPLAVVILAFAAVGIIRLWRADRRALALVALAFGPYLVFDILFQETFTSRYALPLVVPLAFLAVAGLRSAPAPAALVAATAVAMYGAHIGGRSIAAYSRDAAPAFRLLDDMRRAAESAAVKPVLAPDRRQSFDLRRPLVWLGPEAPSFERQLPAPPQHEWLEAVKYWNGGGRAPVWFVVDPRRAAIDLVQHGDPVTYESAVPYPVLLSGTRPNDVNWYRVERPDWYVGEGWALTPESAGVAGADHRGLADGPIDGRVSTGALSGGTLVFGGRNFEPTVRPVVTISAGKLWRSTFQLQAGPFLKVVRMPFYQLDTSVGDYVPLTVTASPPAQVAVEQFDLAPPVRPAIGFGDGWHEQEFNPATGERWRWVSDRAEIRYATTGFGAILHIVGESPRKYYSRDSRIVIHAGDVVLRDAMLSSDFTIDVNVPPAFLTPSTIVIETDQTHSPAERSWRRSADRRRLGLRIYKCELRPITPVSAQGTAGSFPRAR